MSEKELLYIEDALNHAKLAETKCNQCASTLTDPNLQTFVRQMADRNKQIYDALFQLLNSRR
jgi:hypothetical protein